ncbi:hypothetical protein GEMRC1_002476 [Eukaryota sp. GEM-RC1]
MIVSTSKNGTLRLWNFSSLVSPNPTPLLTYRSKLNGISTKATVTHVSALPCPMPSSDPTIKGLIAVSFSDGTVLVLTLASTCSSPSDFSLKEIAKVPSKSCVQSTLITTHPYSNAFFLLIFPLYQSPFTLCLDLTPSPIVSSSLFSWSVTNLDHLTGTPSHSFPAPSFSPSAPYLFVPHSAFVFSYQLPIPATRLLLPSLSPPSSSHVIDGRLFTISNGHITDVSLDKDASNKHWQVPFFCGNVLALKHCPPNRIALIHRTDVSTVNLSILELQDDSISVIHSVSGNQSIAFDCNSDVAVSTSDYNSFNQTDLYSLSVSSHSISNLTDQSDSLIHFLLPPFSSVCFALYLSIELHSGDCTLTGVQFENSGADDGSGKFFQLCFSISDPELIATSSRPFLIWQDESVAALLVLNSVFVLEFSDSSCSITNQFSLDFDLLSPSLNWLGPLLLLSTSNAVYLLHSDSSTKIEKLITINQGHVISILLIES